MADDMIILTRTFDLLAWLLPKTETFPKAYRHTVTQRMMNAALDFQEALFDAHSQGGTTRQKHLRAADAHHRFARDDVDNLQQILRWAKAPALPLNCPEQLS